MAKHNRSQTGTHTMFGDNKEVDVNKMEEITRKEMLKKFKVLK